MEQPAKYFSLSIVELDRLSGFIEVAMKRAVGVAQGPSVAIGLASHGSLGLRITRSSCRHGESKRLQGVPNPLRVERFNK